MYVYIYPREDRDVRIPIRNLQYSQVQCKMTRSHDDRRVQRRRGRLRGIRALVFHTEWFRFFFKT